MKLRNSKHICLGTPGALGPKLKKYTWVPFSYFEAYILAAFAVISASFSWGWDEKRSPEPVVKCVRIKSSSELLEK